MKYQAPKGKMHYLDSIDKDNKEKQKEIASPS